MPKLGEFGIIERYFRREIAGAGLRVGIGDDAAVIDAAGPMAIAVDTVVAGTHFPQGHPADAIGHRALAVNLSDLAAVGARPRWATLALTLPEPDTEWLEGFASGFFALADRFGVGLIGGDTTRGPLTVTVQVLGDSPAAPLLRSGGTIGDRIYVSGTLGDAAAGLELLGRAATARTAAGATLIERFSYPEPRVELGRALAGIATAGIDVSDGLLADIGHVIEQSRCGATIDLGSLPLSAAIMAELAPDRAVAFAAHGGDDYELCFTAPPHRDEAIGAIADRLGVAVTRIGELVAGDSMRLVRDGAPIALESKGFTHF